MTVDARQPALDTLLAPPRLLAVRRRACRGLHVCVRQHTHPAAAAQVAQVDGRPLPSILLVGNPALSLKGFDCAIATLALVHRTRSFEVGWFPMTCPRLLVQRSPACRPNLRACSSKPCSRE